MDSTEREIARRRGGMTGALGGPLGKKTRKPSKIVQLSPIEDPSKGPYSLEPCGKNSLNPCFRPIPLKGPFPGQKTDETER